MVKLNMIQAHHMKEHSLKYSKSRRREGQVAERTLVHFTTFLMIIEALLHINFVEDLTDTLPQERGGRLSTARPYPRFIPTY